MQTDIRKRYLNIRRLHPDNVTAESSRKTIIAIIVKVCQPSLRKNSHERSLLNIKIFKGNE